VGPLFWQGMLMLARHVGLASNVYKTRIIFEAWLADLNKPLEPRCGT
jgi:hypothetical protein